MQITRDLFEQQRHPRFGTANPERIRAEYWEWLVLKANYGPNRARTTLGFKEVPHSGPEWTFARMGSTRTVLADGRIVCIGGEYDDWYDPDFYIYNDVVVLSPYDRIEIYGYPDDVFPPTDFHTATLVGGRIILIGTLGHSARRKPGFTPVYSLDTTTYAIEPVATSGEMPGWIFSHDAEIEAGGKGIVVKGGQTIVEHEGAQIIRTNVEEFRLDLTEFRWRRLTDRSNWRQFLIQREDGHYWFESYEARQEEFPLPQSVTYETLPDLDYRTRQVSIDGICVQISQDSDEVRILVRGALPADVVNRFVQECVATIEAATQRNCRVRQL